MIQEPMMKYANYKMDIWDWDNYDMDGSLYNHANMEDHNPVYCYNDDPSYQLNGVTHIGSKTPYDMFTNESDLAYHKQRTRYYTARYGYSTKIYEFEILSEPWHINEGWTSGQGNQSGINAFEDADHSEHNLARDAVYSYHKEISEYIKDSLQHWRQLIGIDMASGLKVDQGGLDKSITLPSIDIVGFNPYYTAPNALITSLTYKPNTMYNYVQKIKDIRDSVGLKYVPIIIPEGGTDGNYNECSNYAMDPVDKMTLPFTGIAGYNSWPGYTNISYDHVKDVVTMPNHIYDMWKTTIRVKNHMNGVDVINTLSDTWGAWKHGMQKTYLKFIDWNWFGPGGGIYKTFKPDLLEEQYYTSSSKEMVVGYVKNRTYNVKTRGCSNTTFPSINNANYFYTPISINWNNPQIPNQSRLRIKGLKHGEYYKIQWYSFKHGDWLDNYCLKAKNGEIELEYPTITSSNYLSTDNPVIWFVAEKSNCNKNKSALIDDSTKITEDYLSVLKESTIYPNPFDEFFTINSLQDDIFILQTINGEILGEYNIKKGETKISINLPKGLYIGILQNQNQTFKIVKK